MPSTHPRCAQHSLVVAPDGLCVLCRRQVSAGVADARADDAPYAAALAGPQAPPQSAAALKLAGFVALLLLAAAGAGLAFEWSSSEQPELQHSAASAQLPKPDPSFSAELSERDKTKQADLATALELLERSGAEQKRQQQLAAAQADQQRRATQAAREQEERERDRMRHEAVTRDLEDQALGPLRRRVQITLYGTDWCGVCERARAYMRERQIQFKDFDIDHDDKARDRAHALNPRHSVPVIEIDKEHMVGFSPESLEQRITRAAKARKL